MLPVLSAKLQTMRTRPTGRLQPGQADIDHRAAGVVEMQNVERRTGGLQAGGIQRWAQRHRNPSRLETKYDEATALVDCGAARRSAPPTLATVSRPTTVVPANSSSAVHSASKTPSVSNASYRLFFRLTCPIKLVQ